MRLSIFAALAILGALACPVTAQEAVQPDADAAPKVEGIDIEGTEFVVRLADGRTLRSRDLMGAVLNVRFGGKPARFRLAAVEVDPDEPTGTVWLHTLEAPTVDGSWKTYCTAGPDGRRQGFPIMTGSGGAGLVCSSGAIGKCVRFGYRPWATTPDGVSLQPAHAACVRMVRADYGGDRGWTKTGMRIRLYDSLGLHDPEDETDETFEAGWGPDGAVCVHHVRVKENTSLADLEARYPRLRGRTGAICTQAFARANGALLFNHSAP